MWQDLTRGTASCKYAAPFITESWVSICWARPRPAAVNAPSSCPAARRKFCADEKRRQSHNGSSQTLSDRSLPLSRNRAYTHESDFAQGGTAGHPLSRSAPYLRHPRHRQRRGCQTLSGILGHTNASFTLDTYTHVTPDMQKAASGIVGGFMEDLLGKGLRPWQRNGKAEPAL